MDMKKKYMTPSVVVVKYTNKQHLLTTSESIDTGTYGIGYGGVDTGGSLDPASREFDYWDD